MTEKAAGKQQETGATTRFLEGIGFTFIIALIGYGLAAVSGFDHVGPLACAIIIAIIYRQIWGYPEKIRSGIQFSAKKLLRFAIILFGLRLNIDVIIHQGGWVLVRDIGTIIFSIGLTVVIARLLRAEDSALVLLLGIGTGVCGAAAIAATSPILKAKDEDTAIGAGIIALVGTVFSIAYTIIRPFIPLTALQYGLWSGVSLHEIAHVALAGAPAGPDGLAMALLAKLGRVFLLVPLSFILLYWMKRKTKTAAGSGASIEFPWFLVGFIVMSLFGSYVLGHLFTVPERVTNGVSSFSSFILTMAMIGLGLNVSLKDLRTKALKPFLAMLITSVLLSVITFFTIYR